MSYKIDMLNCPGWRFSFLVTRFRGPESRIDVLPSFLAKLPSMEAEIDCKLQFNSRAARSGSLTRMATESVVVPSQADVSRPEISTVSVAESDVAAVSHAISEWALVWVSVSDCLKRWLWQLPSVLQLA